MMENKGRPGILRANAYFLVAGAGLILLSLISPYVVDIIRGLGLELSQMDLMLVLDGLYYLPCVLVPVGIYAWRKGGAGIPTGPVSGGQMVLCMLLAYLCVLLANSIAGLWSMLLEFCGFELYSVDIRLDSTADLIKAIFAMAVLPGICEELLFRGVVLSAYERGGTRTAIAVSSVLFAVLHGSVQGLPAQLLIGIILGFAVCNTGSIYTGMMIHTSYNAFILIITYATADMATESTEVVGSMMTPVLAVFWAVEAAVTLLIIWAILKGMAKKAAEAGIAAIPQKKFSMDNTAKIVLVSGIVTVGYMYLQDILMLMGYNV